jgi:hypothetical protein
MKKDYLYIDCENCGNINKLKLSLETPISKIINDTKLEIHLYNKWTDKQKTKYQSLMKEIQQSKPGIKCKYKNVPNLKLKNLLDKFIEGNITMNLLTNIENINNIYIVSNDTDFQSMKVFIEHTFRLKKIKSRIQLINV